jgi:hypothetical protein
MKIVLALRGAVEADEVAVGRQQEQPTPLGVLFERNVDAGWVTLAVVVTLALVKY